MFSQIAFALASFSLGVAQDLFMSPSDVSDVKDTHTNSLMLSTAPAPNVRYARSASNLNSLEEKQVAITGVDSQYVKHLGHSAMLEGCAQLCINYSSRASDMPRCLSFTRYASVYPANQSLAGLCIGHTDPVWLPLPVAGKSQLDSGVVEWSCVSDMDCSLNGKCSSSTGECICNTGWGGVRCELLKLAPVDRTVLGFNPQQNGQNMSSWGGSIQQIDGVWHMWAVRMANHCGISSYLVNSGVVHAVSTTNSVLGPYDEQDTVLPPFAHEPDVVRSPSGEIVMIAVSGSPEHGYNGSYSPCQCVTGATAQGCNTCNNSCFRQYPTVSVTKKPTGPWDTKPINDQWRGENPSIWITKSGEVYGMSRGGHISVYASDWSNFSTWTHETPHRRRAFITGKPDVEDPFIYQDGDDHWHALLHNLEGPHHCRGVDNCMVGTHAYSEDGLAWYYTGVAYTNHVNLTDGGYLQLDRRERPHLVFAEGTRTPVALSTSAQVGGEYRDRSFTLVQGIVP